MSDRSCFDEYVKINNFFKLLEDKKLFLSKISQDGILLKKRYSLEFDVRLNRLLKLRKQIIGEIMYEDEFLGLMLEIRAYQFCMKLETLKIMLAKMINPEKIRTKKELNDDNFCLSNLTLGGLIHRINDVVYPLEGLANTSIQSQKKLRDNNQELLFRTFRNAIIHRDFTIVGTNLLYGKKPDIFNSKIHSEFYTKMMVLDVLFQNKFESLLAD